MKRRKKPEDINREAPESLKEKESEEVFERPEDDSEPETTEENDEEEDDDDDNRGMIAVTVLGFAIAAMVLIIAVLLFSGVLPMPGTGNHNTGSQSTELEEAADSSDGKVTVPDITGKTESEAEKILAAENLGIKFSEEKASNEEEGTIIEQSPKAGAKVSEHTTVTYVRSSGPEQLDFPDLTGEYLADAKVTLQNEGFTTITIKQKHSEKSLGTVISTSPEEGTKTTTSSEVTLNVSTGQKSKTAYTKDYSGMTLTNAAKEAAEDGIVCDFTYGESDFVEAGQVMSQDIEPGSQVASGTILTLTVSEGEPETEDAEQTVTLNAPKNYGGGEAVFALVQEQDDREYQIVEKTVDQADFPLSLTLKKAAGISEGTLWLYEKSGDTLTRRASWNIS